MRMGLVRFAVLSAVLAGCGEGADAPLDAGHMMHVVVVRVLGDGVGHVDGTGMLDCDTDGGGRCFAYLEHGAALHLEAHPEAGSTLVAWNEGGCDGGASCDLVVDHDLALEVTFAPFDDGRASRAVRFAGTGAGRVTSAPEGIDCDVDCEARFPRDATIELTAVAAAGSEFTGWAGVCTGAEPVCTVAPGAAGDAIAVFERLAYDVDVRLEGGGTVELVQGGASRPCGTSCRTRVAHGDTLVLDAHPDVGSEPAAWGGACAHAGTAARCELVVTGTREVEAVFARRTFAVAILRDGDGSGRVLAEALDCGTTCDATVPYGTTLQFQAVADEGSEFVGWSGACEGTGTCTQLVVEGVTLHATFARRRHPHTVTVASLRGGVGRVVSTAAGIDCPGSCAADVAHGEMVVFEAMPAPGSTFVGWSDGSGICSGTGSCTLLANAPHALTATFAGHTRVALDPAARDPDIRLREDDRLAADLDLDFGGVRSDVAIAPGAGVFYFEGHRTTDELGPYGVGICSGTYDLVGTSVGSTDQAFGVTATGGIDHAGAFQGYFDAHETEYYGIVLDYRGAHPIVHAITRDYDWDAGEVRPHVVRSMTLTSISTPVYLLVAGMRTVVGPEIEINPGNDTTNFPFHYDVDAILRASGLADTADALVPGWGSTYAAPLDVAPTLAISADVTVTNGAQVTVTATASDAEDGDLTSSITWELLSSPYYEGRVVGQGGSFTFEALGVGVHPARAMVMDAAGRRTARTVRVTVPGPVAHHATVQLVHDPWTGAGTVLDASGTSVRFTGLGKMGIRANQSCYGCYAYFEFSRLHAPENMGGGLVTGTGNLNPFDWSDVPASVAVNVLGGSWRNLIPKASFPGPSSSFDTYGVVVDYRTEHPIVYVIVGGVLHYEVVLDDVTTEVYPMLYGNPFDTPVGSYDEHINFGASPFVYDPVAVLASEGIDTTGLTVGWGL